MQEAQRLAAEASGAIDGDPWFGPTADELLEGVDAGAASTRVPGASHSIWEIVLHMTSWARYGACRLRNGALDGPPDGDWPRASCADGVAWDAALVDLRTAHDELVEALSSLPADALDSAIPEAPLDDCGQPVTLYRIAAGVAQHDAYHCGQIAVLKKMLAASQSDSD